MLAVRDAARILKDADPEEEDADLLERIKALGFPQAAAVRVFRHATRRYAPLTCRSCKKVFTPKAMSTIDWPWCHKCRKAETPEQEFKNRARRLAMQALDKGKIKRKPCERCGTTLDLHMHHPDYSRPRYVIWLCVRCHAAEHKAEGVSRATV
jgi:hypothetical protein